MNVIINFDRILSSDSFEDCGLSVKLHDKKSPADELLLAQECLTGTLENLLPHEISLIDGLSAAASTT